MLTRTRLVVTFIRTLPVLLFSNSVFHLLAPGQPRKYKFDFPHFAIIKHNSHNKSQQDSLFLNFILVKEELNDFYSSPNIVRLIKSRRMRWAGHVACMGEERGVYRVLVGKPKGRRPLGRPRHRWVDNIRMDLLEVGCGYMDWIGLAQDRDRWRTLVSAVMNLRVPRNAGNFLTNCKPVSFSRRTLQHGVSK